MRLMEINWHPTERQLRQFGVICPFAFAALSWIWGARPPLIAGLTLGGLLIALVGWLAPGRLRLLFVTMSVVGAPLGLLAGEVAMLMLYFGVFLPIGLVFRLVGRDHLRLRLDRRASSYWQPKPQPRDVASYYRQS